MRNDFGRDGAQTTVPPERRGGGGTSKAAARPLNTFTEHLHGEIKEELPRVSRERGAFRDSGAGGVHSEKYRRKSKR